MVVSILNIVIPWYTLDDNWYPMTGWKFGDGWNPMKRLWFLGMIAEAAGPLIWFQLVNS